MPVAIATKSKGGRTVTLEPVAAEGVGRKVLGGLANGLRKIKGEPLHGRAVTAEEVAAECRKPSCICQGKGYVLEHGTAPTSPRTPRLCRRALERFGRAHNPITDQDGTLRWRKGTEPEAHT